MIDPSCTPRLLRLLASIPSNFVAAVPATLAVSATAGASRQPAIDAYAKGKV